MLESGTLLLTTHSLLTLFLFLAFTFFPLCHINWEHTTLQIVICLFFLFFFWGYDGIMTFKTAYLILERLSRWFKACLVGSTHLLCCTTSGLFYVCVWDTLKHVWLRVHIRRWAVQVCFVDLWEMDAHSVQFCLPQSHSDSGLHTSGCKIRSVWFPVHIRNIMWGLLNILKWLKNMSEDVSFGARK